MTEEHYDVVILGGGSGGYAAALRAAQRGSRVVVVEKDKVGGTCLHRGCVPTKALLHTAEVADTVREAGTAGVQAAFEGVDGVAALAFRSHIVASKYKGLQSLLTARGVTVVTGTGRLTTDGAVAVGDDLYRGTHVVIATGARSRQILGIPQGPRIVDSEAALAMTSIPQRVVVLGGGVIGVEFASAWRSLGAEVTIVEALDRLAAAEDSALSKALERAFRKRGIVSILGARVAGAEEDADGIRVTLDDGRVLDGDLLLVAVGRAPVTDDIGLEAAGVVTDRGFVIVDEQLRTKVPGIWAVGDVVAGLQLAHRGFQHGLAVADRIHGIEVPPVPDTHVPRVTYSHPELASVGLTEAQAIEHFGSDRIAVAEFNLAGNAKSEIIGTSGLAKVIREVDGPVLGVHLAGDRVGELITEGQLAVSWDAFPEDLAAAVHAHPTQSEALGEAFLALTGHPLHMI